MKLTYALKVFTSCKTVDQMSSAILWIGRIRLSSEDCRRFIHLTQNTPNFDLAVQQAKEIYTWTR